MIQCNGSYDETKVNEKTHILPREATILKGRQNLLNFFFSKFGQLCLEFIGNFCQTAYILL
jgi:hypothetical protein